MNNYKNNTLIENFEKDYYNLEELKKTKDKQLINFYNSLITNELFFNYYNECKSIEKIIKAGFFTETKQTNYHLNIFTTPFNKLNIKENEINYILLTTGGFAPIHKGHINLLEQVKKYMNNENLHIAGGYISPSHDDYVLTKRNQHKDMNIFNRLNICNKELIDNDWIMVDPFEGLICKNSINFTKVIDRLQKYLEYHFKNYKFQIIFCYGTDNKDFAKLFENNGILSFCVNRDKNIIDLTNDYTIYLNDYINISSSELRNNFKLDKIQIENKFYYIRDDLDYLGLKDITKVRKIILNIFNKYVNNIKVVKINEEKDITLEQIISLDFYTKGKHNLNYSRLFNLCDNQIKSNTLINRLGYENNLDDIDKSIEYTLLDDDISSGNTIKNIINILNNNRIKIKDYITKIDNDNVYDVNDLRDFIFGSKNGGLTCSLPNGKLVRVPYIYPYINLNNRSSIKNENILDFSKDIIFLNLMIYKDKKIKDFDSNFILFLESQGYHKNQLFEDYLNDLLKII